MIVEVTIIMLRLSSADSGKAKRNAQMQQPSLAAAAARGCEGRQAEPVVAAAAAPAAAAPAQAAVASAGGEADGAPAASGDEYTGSSRMIAASGLRRRTTPGAAQ